MHCSKSTIEIKQAPATPLNGIPQYRVEIANTCNSGCNITNIHVDCGMFSSARLINPTIFKRLNYSDCLNFLFVADFDKRQNRLLLFLLLLQDNICYI
ncbi:hypothetical protein P8452_13178 [Trifolium repens]|nr:hypothetical protein P8452_13178 [Trifolium repens]